MFFSLAHVPGPAEKRMAVRITPAAERALRGGHPWLFAQAIRRQSHDGRCGDLAVIFDRKDRFLAVGLYDPFSPIRVRVLQQGEPARIGRSWFQKQLETAVQRRAPLQKTTATSGYRLVHGENDGLPGLVVDRYDQTYVLKVYTPAWIPHLNDFLVAFTRIITPHCVVLRLSRTVRKRPQVLYGLADGEVLVGTLPNSPLYFRENGLRFEVDVVAGQKTGFFLDQRENRARVESLAAGKSVLNVFAYTGGFSLYAARGGAPHVVSLDISQPALAAAVRNFRLNEGKTAVAAATHELLLGDAFRTLRELRTVRRHFDLVVIDPPAFAKSQSEVQRALTAYGRLARLGLGVLRREGILVMASCSSRVDAATFYKTVHQAAAKVKRPLQEIGRRGHPLDHPVGFKEGAYLKCLYAVAM